MAIADDLLAHNERYAHERFVGMRPLQPARHLAIVACMDSRMDIFEMLGLQNGDAHIIRNAGGVVTDDVIRSLLLSQRLLGTTEVILVHHTDCGLTKVTDDELKGQLEAETGIRPSFAIECFTDPYADVRQSIARLRNSPFVASKDQISGYVYEVETGLLRPVGAADGRAPAS